MSILPPSIGVQTPRAGRRNRRPAKAAGRCSIRGTPARFVSIPRPIPQSAPTARRRGSAGQPARRSKPRSTPGTNDEEKAAIARLNKAAFEDVIYAPTGFFLAYQAWRKSVGGIVKGPLPFFWGVSKAA